MYFPYFITYIALGALLTGMAFVWAVKNRQFSDQQRARFLPLEADTTDTKTVSGSRISRYEIYTLFFLAFAGLAASAAVLIFAIFYS